jgi:hypothetical protein
MSLEFRLLQNMFDAIEKAMPEITPAVSCPKCRGPMNLVRDAYVTRTDGCRKSDLYLCDNAKCDGWSVLEP